MPSVEKSTMFPCTIKMEKRKVRLEGIRRGIQTFPPPLYTVHYVYIKEMGNRKTINISCCFFLLFGMVTRVRRDKRQPMTLDFVFQICLICLFMHLHFRGRTISPEIEDQREKEIFLLLSFFPVHVVFSRNDVTVNNTRLECLRCAFRVRFSRLTICSVGGERALTLSNKRKPFR